MSVDAAHSATRCLLRSARRKKAFDNVKTLRDVATERVLHALAYNIKRVIAILGVQELLRAI
jgi:hypothetical protein